MKWVRERQSQASTNLLRKISGNKCQYLHDKMDSQIQRDLKYNEIIFKLFHTILGKVQAEGKPM